MSSEFTSSEDVVGLPSIHFCIFTFILCNRINATHIVPFSLKTEIFIQDCIQTVDMILKFSSSSLLCCSSCQTRLLNDCPINFKEAKGNMIGYPWWRPSSKEVVISKEYQRQSLRIQQLFLRLFLFSQDFNFIIFSLCFG